MQADSCLRPAVTKLTCLICLHWWESSLQLLIHKKQLE